MTTENSLSSLKFQPFHGVNEMMQLKFNTIAVAVAIALAGGAAQAAITNAAAAPGNSSALFVAWDNAKTTSLTIDLGVNLTDFLGASSFTSGAGALSGSVSTWSFGSDSRKVNGTAVAGDYAWSGEFSNFLSAIGGGAYQWGVVAGDNVTGAISANNVVQNRTVLSTGTPSQANITSVTSSNSLSTAPANFNYFSIESNALGTHATNAEGANTATSGQAYLGTVMKGNFASLPWSYLSDVGATTNLFLTQQFGNPVVYQIGQGGTFSTVDTLLAQGATTVAFNGSTLTINAVTPVPEPSTIAMMLAGLGLVGSIARRRRAAR
jgi:hypothetical protein